MKRLVGLVATAALTAGGIVTMANPAWAACGLGANNPTGTISGTGSRSGCGGTVTLTVRVRHEFSFSPDVTVASASRTGFGNGSLTANGSCDGHGTYHTDTTSSSGNSLKSGSVSRC
jgi:hypothetical protein